MAKKAKTITITLTQDELSELLTALDEQVSAQWDEVREMDGESSDEEAAETFLYYRRLQRLYAKLALQRK